MKRIISLSLLVLSVVIFFWLSSYTNEWPFDYHVSEFVGYLFYWSVTLFVVSLFALMLDERKYKIWLLVTSIYVLVSILFAYGTGDGEGNILSFDGEAITWFFAGLYSFVCIIYFIIQFIKKHKNR